MAGYWKRDTWKSSDAKSRRIRHVRSTWVSINRATLLLFGAMLGLMKSEGMVAKLIDPSLPGVGAIQSTETAEGERRGPWE